MNKHDFLSIVYQTLKDHPEWFADTVIASQQSLMDRTQEESIMRSKAETAVVLLFDHADSVPEPQRELVITCIKNCKAYEGSDYVKNLK